MGAARYREEMHRRIERLSANAAVLGASGSIVAVNEPWRRFAEENGLRDGSGAEGSNDLAATTQSTPKVGETITVECGVALDRDVGAGYRFPTLLEDCRVE